MKLETDADISRVRLALAGWDLLPSRFVEVGKMFMIHDTHSVILHPLDLIALQFWRDPIARLDAVRSWVAKQAERAARHAVAKLEHWRDPDGVCYLCGAQPYETHVGVDLGDEVHFEVALETYVRSADPPPLFDYQRDWLRETLRAYTLPPVHRPAIVPEVGP